MKTKTPPQQLVIFVGSTKSQCLESVSKIKNAMISAIMMQVENDTCGQKNESFCIFQSIYLEANYLETQLKNE